ncbi:MAG: YggW family oxidoreductase [Legionellales bacterium]|nr:YggW family oxidoreductase [Legionellales bacterium]
MAQLAQHPHEALALYIHLPWCIKRCPYCDFNAHALKGSLPEQRYIQALKADLTQTLKTLTPAPLISIFFGGGTPSLCAPEGIASILEHVNQSLTIPTECEITLEANPGTLDQSKLLGFNHAGINRLSLGVQSFNDDALMALGRIHNAQTAYATCQTALDLDFESVNIDLMFGVPHQTEQSLMDDLFTATQLGFQHISWYELTIEPNTAFAHQPPQRASRDQRAEWTALGQTYLAQQGFEHYEISAFCKPGFQCQHNTWVWSFGDYLGIGAGAHSKLTDPNGIAQRWVRYKHPTSYMQHTSPIECSKTIQTQEYPFEFLLNRLRLFQPIPWNIANRFAGIHPTLPAMQTAFKEGLLLHHETSFELTERGRWFLDDLVALFL